MTSSRRYPISLRLGQILRILGTLLLVAFLIYVGSAVYYASKLEAPSGATPIVSVVSGNAFEVSSSYNLTDPGPYSISGLTVESHLNLPNSSVIIESLTPPVSLSGYGTAQVTLSFRIPLDQLTGSARSLLVNSTSLPTEIWVNASYAHLAGISIFTEAEYAWGAPFSGFALAFQPPTTEPNGTRAIGVTLGFQDLAPIPVDGVFAINLPLSTGGSCVTFHWPVAVASGSVYSEEATVYLPSGCSPDGGYYLASWSGSGFQTALPPGSGP